jgi:hypothetical protein
MAAQVNKPRRSSKFREVGLEYEFADPPALEDQTTRRPAVRFDSKPKVHLIERERQDSATTTPGGEPSGPLQQSTGEGNLSSLSRNSSLMFRFATVVLVVASLLPFLRLGSTSAIPLQGVEGGPIPFHAGRDDGDVTLLSRQDDTSTDVCFRWAQQSALVNGTLYLYGGQASTEQGQDQNTWNNDFLTLDLTRTWNIAEPSLTRLPSPSGSSGPPAVALGYLWSSHESLFLYGGQFSWKPADPPTKFSTWEYSIPGEEWIEHSAKTTKGESAPSDNDDVQRASEGAGVNVPSLGRGFYFGGHLDTWTTQGWSNTIARVYLQSLLEFTFPGYSNNEVESLSDGKTAGDQGSYRNITEGGIQDKSGFTQRADGNSSSHVPYTMGLANNDKAC